MGRFSHDKLVLGPLDLFRPFLTFFDLFSLIYPIYILIYDWSPWFMIDLPPAGGGIRTRDLVVESRRVQDHWAIPVIPSKWYSKYPLVPKQKKKRHLHKLPTIFRIYPPPSQKNMFWARWTFLGLFFPNPKIPKTSTFAKMNLLKENYDKIETPWAYVWFNPPNGPIPSPFG